MEWQLFFLCTLKIGISLFLIFSFLFLFYLKINKCLSIFLTFSLLHIFFNYFEDAHLFLFTGASCITWRPFWLKALSPKPLSSCWCFQPPCPLVSCSLFPEYCFLNRCPLGKKILLRYLYFSLDWALPFFVNYEIVKPGWFNQLFWISMLWINIMYIV